MKMAMMRAQLAVTVMLGMVALLNPPAAGSDLSGRPPVNALERVEPQVFEVTMQVNITPGPPFRDRRIRPRDYDPDLQPDASRPMRMPLIMMNTWNRVDRDSIRLQLWVDEWEDQKVRGRAELRSDLPFGGYELRWNLPEERMKNAQRARWKVTYDTIVWASKLDEDEAARAAWPRSWPAEVRDALQPQRLIESDHEIFRATVERVSEGKLQNVPIYYAVKDLLRYTIRQVQVTGGSERRIAEHHIQGLNVQGALKTAQAQQGSEHDLVCLCVAMLRAAGIPARPVIGIEYERRPDTRFPVRSWGEFYLPESGWVPFHPIRMRDGGLHRNVQETWPGIGTIDEHNRFVPIAFHFNSPHVEGSHLYPTIWSWIDDPKGRTAWFQSFQLSVGWKGEPEPEDH